MEWFERDLVRMQLLAEMESYPILLCPACAIPAFRHGERSWQVEGKTVRYLHPERDVMSYSQWFNLSGNPGVVVPVGRSPERLPIGVQLVSRPWREEEALAVAAAVERAFGYRPPPLPWARHASSASQEQA